MTQQQLISAMVLSTIMLDGERVFPGDDDTAVIVELTPRDFAELSAINAVVEVGEIVGVDSETLELLDPAQQPVNGSELPDGQDGSNGTDTGGTDAPPTLDDIVAAIGKLTTEQFTQSGAPEVKALEAVLKAEISAAQRDEAWTVYQAQKQAETEKSE